MKACKVIEDTIMHNNAWTHNWTRGGLQFYTEIRNNNTRHVWLCQTPMTKLQFQQLLLPYGFSKVAIGRSAHDLTSGTKLYKERALPEIWSVREETLKGDLLLEIPYSARVCFFDDTDGFHGPGEM